jgi:hypothetical protein
MPGQRRRPGPFLIQKVRGEREIRRIRRIDAADHGKRPHAVTSAAGGPSQRAGIDPGRVMIGRSHETEDLDYLKQVCVSGGCNASGHAPGL